MKFARSLLAAIIVAPLIASCTGQTIVPYNDPASEAQLAQRLAGKVAGAPVNCLPNYRTNDFEVIDRDTFLYRDGGTYYRQDTIGACYPGTSSGYALVTNSIGGQLCAGDIARTVDTSSGMIYLSCELTPFVPFRRP
ncbi:MAG: hypothetical protein LH465_01175 [Sphingomonas bacterium]|nr:hypothetical protein [Sphingomonas bacterium]